MDLYYLLEWPQSKSYNREDGGVFDVIHEEALKSPAIAVRKDIYEKHQATERLRQESDLAPAI